MKQFAIALSLLFCISAPVQSQDSESIPGQVDFDSLTAIYGEPRVMINISGALMQLLTAAAAASDEPRAANVMKDLDGVRVNIYDIDGNTEPALEQMNNARSALEAARWQPIVQVKEKGENIQMFSRLEGDVMQGMVIMVVDSQEAVFMNILGTINPAEAAVVMKQLDIDTGPEGE